MTSSGVRKFHFPFSGLLVLTLLCYKVPESIGLSCYQCINVDCGNSNSFICDSVRRFVLERLNEIYYDYGLQVPFCPDVDDADGWGNLVASSRSCGQESSGEATCSVGRFRITTTIMDANENITSYGTALGCARRKLLEIAKQGLKGGECSLVIGYSAIRATLKHYLEVEHCFDISNMCKGRNFCVTSDKSVIKKFREDVTEEGHIATGLIVAIILAIAIIIAVLFLLGIKYDS